MTTTKKVLVVEDERPLAHALELKLSGNGFHVTVVENGAEALDKLRKEAYDIMLLDLMMPVMNGFEVLEAMKKDDIKCRVYVLSNLSQNEDEEKVRALGAADFFVKSDTPLSEIVSKISG